MRQDETRGQEWDRTMAARIGQAIRETDAMAEPARSEQRMKLQRELWQAGGMGQCGGRRWNEWLAEWRRQLLASAGGSFRKGHFDPAPPAVAGQMAIGEAQQGSLFD